MAKQQSRTSHLEEKLAKAILKAIKASGGKAKRSDVIHQIEKNEKFDSWAEDFLPSGKKRWSTIVDRKSSAKLVNRGLLEKNKGIWSITPKGSTALEMNSVETFILGEIEDSLEESNCMQVLRGTLKPNSNAPEEMEALLFRNAYINYERNLELENINTDLAFAKLLENIHTLDGQERTGSLDDDDIYTTLTGAGILAGMSPNRNPDRIMFSKSVSRQERLNLDSDLEFGVPAFRRKEFTKENLSIYEDLDASVLANNFEKSNNSIQEFFKKFKLLWLGKLKLILALITGLVIGVMMPMQLATRGSSESTLSKIISNFKGGDTVASEISLSDENPLTLSKNIIFTCISSHIEVKVVSGKDIKLIIYNLKKSDDQQNILKILLGLPSEAEGNVSVTISKNV